MIAVEPTPFEINPTKAPVTSEQRQYFLPVEKNVNGFQRPILIEDDAVAEESGPIEDHAVMQEIEQCFFVANAAHFVTGGQIPLVPTNDAVAGQTRAPGLP